MIALDALKAALLLFAVAVVQVSLLSSLHVAGGMPNLLLVTIVAVALLRGSTVGALGGFWGGLLLDTASLETLGLTSLILTVGGYWIGRYGETTGRDRTHAPFVSVAVVTVLYAAGVLVLHFLLGDPVSARVLLLDSLVPTIAFNLILTAPVYWLVKKLLPPLEWQSRAGRCASLASRPASSFMPGDARVEEPYRLTPQAALRIAVLGSVALLVFGALFLRLWALQVLSGHQYLRVAQNNQLRTVRPAAPRGPILDRNGRVLVANVAGTAVQIRPADLPKTWPERRRELRLLSQIVHTPSRRC